MISPDERIKELKKQGYISGVMAGNLTIRMRTRAVESDYIDVSLKYMQNILNESFLMK